MENDSVNHPKHYTSHPSGVECADITDYLNFNLGNAWKYVWRAGLKFDALEDLRKVNWYILREIRRRKALAMNGHAGESHVPDALVARFRQVLRHEAGAKAAALQELFKALENPNTARHLEAAGDYVDQMIREIAAR